MKTIQTLTNLLAIACVIAFSSCKKDEEKQAPQIKPLQSYLADSILLVGKREGPWELGYTFTSTKKGKITQIGVGMPDPGSYVVRVWDADSKSLLIEKTVEQSTSATKVYVPINSLEISLSKKYVISLTCDNKPYYYAYNKDYKDILPFSSGNIVVLDARYNASSNLGKFPDNVVVSYEIYGFADFVFQEN